MKGFLGQVRRLGAWRVAVVAAAGAAVFALLAAAAMGAGQQPASQGLTSDAPMASASGRIPSVDGARAALEDSLAARVRSLVESLVGAGRARAFVSADIDERQVTTEQESFDPDSQVVRSETKGRESPAGGDPALATTSYEISKTVTTAVQPPGSIRRLSVAVAVDGAASGAGSARRRLSPAEVRRIEALVRAAVGFSAARGDQVQVFDVRFAAAAPARGDVVRPLEIGAAAAVAALVMGFAAAPILRRAATRFGPGAGAGDALGAAPEEPAIPAGARNLTLAGAATGKDAGALLRAAAFAETHPEASARVLKSWLREVA